MVTNSLVCFFASYFPDVETKKATNGHPEILMGTDPPQKSFTNTLLSPGKGPKEQPSRTEDR
jgi:hypothetical protein